uniref:Uncharacterized protein n=1 Tax=Romanomermis culicivorax TaxID=13658 RepID=A0A915IQ13_ROMCU
MLYVAMNAPNMMVKIQNTLPNLAFVKKSSNRPWKPSTSRFGSQLTEFVCLHSVTLPSSNNVTLAKDAECEKLPIIGES